MYNLASLGCQQLSVYSNEYLVTYQYVHHFVSADSDLPTMCLIHVSQLVHCLYMEVNKEVKSQNKIITPPICSSQADPLINPPAVVCRHPVLTQHRCILECGTSEGVTQLGSVRYHTEHFQQHHNSISLHLSSKIFSKYGF